MIQIRDGMKIVFIGDSITDVKFNKNFRRKLKGAKSYPLNVRNEIKRRGFRVTCFFEGIASNRTYHVYDRLTKDCIDKKPDLIIMLIGVNDAWEDYVPEQYPPKTRLLEPHFREILRRFRAEIPQAKLLLLTPFLTSSIPEKQSFHKILNENIKKEQVIAAEFGYEEIIDLQTAFDEAEKTTKPVLLSTDSVHPTSLGHEVISTEIIKRLSF